MNFVFVILNLALISYFWIIVVEIDKKIRFHKVYGVEYLMRMKKYSNTEYLARSWLIVIIGMAGLFVAFRQTIHNMMRGNVEKKLVGDR